MSRSVFVPCAVLATTTMFLTGCGSNVASSSSTASPAAINTPAVISTAAGKAIAKQAPKPSTPLLDPLAALPQSKFMAVVLTPAQVSTFSPSMTRTVHDPSVGADPTVTGVGGSCPVLAKLMSKSLVFGDGGTGTVDVSYDNTSSATGAQNDFKMIGQSIETSSRVDPVATVRSYRAAIAGCPNKVSDGDGFTATLRLLPDPVGLGTESFSMELTTDLGETKVKTVLVATASGRNGMAIMTTGYTPAQDAGIAAQAWKNLTATR